MIFTIILYSLFVSLGVLVKSEQQIDSKHLRCLVCRVTVEEFEKELGKIDPKLSIDVGNYRLDKDGNVQQKSVPLAQSEVHISELLDGVCERLDDYVRATYKTNGELTLLRLMTAEGGLNPDISKVDIVQDGDLNKSLKFYCEGIVEEFEDDFVRLYTKGDKDGDVRICTDAAQYCSDTISEEDGLTGDDEFDFDFDEKDEL